MRRSSRSNVKFAVEFMLEVRVFGFIGNENIRKLSIRRLGLPIPNKGSMNEKSNHPNQFGYSITK